MEMNNNNLFIEMNMNMIIVDNSTKYDDFIFNDSVHSTFKHSKTICMIGVLMNEFYPFMDWAIEHLSYSIPFVHLVRLGFRHF